MMNPTTAKMLTEYNAWADETLFEGIANLPQDFVYHKTNTLFGTMLGTLNHNLQIDHIWRSNLLGESHGYTKRNILLHSTFEDLVKAQAASNNWFITWAAAQEPRNFEEKISFQYTSGASAVMTKGGMLLHVINHKTYHRGWVAEMFFDANTKPPETDLCIFLSNNLSPSQN